VLTLFQDLFLSVLSATTTKRDAKAYLSRFRPKHASKTASESQTEDNAPFPINVALVKIRGLQYLDDKTLEGIAHTLSQLSQLGLSPVVVIDDAVEGEAPEVRKPSVWRDELVWQADRMVSALQRETSSRTSRLDYVLGTSNEGPVGNATTAVSGDVRLQHPDALLGLLKRGSIPVIPPVAYTSTTQKVQRVEADEVVLALTRNFSGLDQLCDPGVVVTEQDSPTARSTATLDRIILLDPLGGLPSAQRRDSAHVFINMEQEYTEVREELLGTHISAAPQAGPRAQTVADAGAANLPESLPSTPPSMPPMPKIVTNQNVKNLDLLQKALAILPPSASAILTTPNEAATFTNTDQLTAAELGVITRRPRNPLIHNLLTDKSLVSSSLPVARLDTGVFDSSRLSPQPNRATFVKRGMPLTIIPDPRMQAWTAPSPHRRPLRLDDPTIDLSRLTTLIEDSFGRPLDIEHYMNRIRNNLAGIIVAGEYEGGAILTWELPPGVPDDGSESSRARMVPYLDKFAVLKRSQGAGGVADIVFSAMVRTCFPQGVCWRSRKDNPVNKWYFERSVGTYKIPGTNWTTFWTAEDLYQDRQRFHDYVNVCRNVQPSWADLHKQAAD